MAIKMKTVKKAAATSAAKQPANHSANKPVVKAKPIAKAANATRGAKPARPAAKAPMVAARSPKPAAKAAAKPAGKPTANAGAKLAAKPAAKAAAKPAAKAAAKPAAEPGGKPATPSVARAVSGDGTAASPWKLTTPPGASAFEAYRDDSADPPALVCQVGSTQLRYNLRCIDDLHAMLKDHGDWMPLGGADEKAAAADGTVEAWGRAPHNPVGGWYGTRNGFRGRFGVYVPPVLEALGLAEVEHGARNNRMRAR